MTTVFLSFLGISASISLIVLALILLTPFLNKRYAAKWTYLIWIFLALRLLVPISGANGPLVMDILSQIRPQTVHRAEEKDTDILDGGAISSRRIIVEIPTQMTTPITTPSEKNNLEITILDILAIVWMIGSLFMIAVHLVSYLYYKRQVMNKGRTIKDVHILHQMSKLKRELHIKYAIQIVEYSKAKSPMILGFLRPVLVLPKEQYSSEELYFILKHELVHLRRKDVYAKLLFVVANALHWFNPCIWMMQKEAVIDMELSCDERVTKGSSYAVRKAYTETLLSMLHKRCTNRTILSTQFYGGTEIMKKRFKNILIKNGKKNGISVLLGAMILTVSLGTLVGCSITKEEAEALPETENISDASEKEETQEEQMFEKDSNDDNTRTLTFSKEGVEEQKEATIVVGDGYSLYLFDDEWEATDVNTWTAKDNEKVQLWITHFEGKTMDVIEQELADDGYITEEAHHHWKQEEDQIYHVKVKDFEDDRWGVFYCYPVEAEEGWGRELSLITDTFVFFSKEGENTKESLKEEDSQEIRN